MEESSVARTNSSSSFERAHERRIRGARIHRALIAFVLSSPVFFFLSRRTTSSGFSKLRGEITIARGREVHRSTIPPLLLFPSDSFFFGFSPYLAATLVGLRKPSDSSAGGCGTRRNGTGRGRVECGEHIHRRAGGGPAIPRAEWVRDMQNRHLNYAQRSRRGARALPRAKPPRAGGTSMRDV